MRKAGWTVTDDGGANKSHAVTWTIARPEKVCIPDSPTSPTGAQASQASNESEPSQDDETGFTTSTPASKPASSTQTREPSAVLRETGRAKADLSGGPDR